MYLGREETLSVSTLSSPLLDQDYNVIQLNLMAMQGRDWGKKFTYVGLATHNSL
jgi:hypothetical protein